MGSHSLLQGIFPTQGSNPGLPHCGQIFLSAEPQGKPKNTGVGYSLPLLQRIFPSQESNQHLLHCRWILNQLSYEGSPHIGEGRSFTEFIASNTNLFLKHSHGHIRNTLLPVIWAFLSPVKLT